MIYVYLLGEKKPSVRFAGFTVCNYEGQSESFVTLDKQKLNIDLFLALVRTAQSSIPNMCVICLLPVHSVLSDNQLKFLASSVFILE